MLTGDGALIEAFPRIYSLRVENKAIVALAFRGRGITNLGA